MSSVNQNNEQYWSTKYDEKSLNSVRPAHSGQGITHRGFCSHVNLVCYIHTFSLWVRTRTLYPIARLNALVEETTCSGQLVRAHSIIRSMPFATSWASSRVM